MRLAALDAIAAYNNIVARGPGTVLGPQLAGLTLTPGLYSLGATADLAAGGTLTLNGPGIFIFSVGSALTANVLIERREHRQPLQRLLADRKLGDAQRKQLLGNCPRGSERHSRFHQQCDRESRGDQRRGDDARRWRHTIGGCSGAAAPPAVSTITLVNAAASGNFPAETIFGGLALTGLEVSSGVEVGPTGTHSES